MNTILNRMSIYPVRKHNSPDRRKMSTNENFNDIVPVFLKSKNPIDKVSFTSGSKLNYMA